MNVEELEKHLDRLRTLKHLIKHAINFHKHIDAYEYCLALIENIDLQLQLAKGANNNV